MPSCFVVGCDSGYNGGKSHLFKIPRRANQALKKLWIKNIPKRECEFNLKTHCICILHFEHKYILKHNVILVNGEWVPWSERLRWTLSDDAVPTIFSNKMLPKYLDKTNSKIRKPPRKRSGSSGPSSLVGKRLVSTAAKAAVTPTDEFSKILEERDQIVLPNQNWTTRVSDVPDSSRHLIFLEMGSISNDTIEIMKSVKVNQNREVEFRIRGKVIPDFINNRISNVEEVTKILSKVHSQSICSGILNFHQVDSSKNGHKMGTTWYSNNCNGILMDASKICKNCSLLKNSLKVIKCKMVNQSKYKFQRFRTPSNPVSAVARAKRLQNLLSATKSRLQKIQKRTSALSIHLKLMKQKFKKLDESKICELLKTTDVPHNLKLAFSESLKMAKAKSSTGMRFEADWLLQCLLVKIKSPKAYRYLRDNKYLPLPHPTTLQKFAFTSFIFEAIKNEYKKKEQDKHGVIVFDEMKILEALDFDKTSLKFNGFIHYGQFTGDYSSKIGLEIRLADHALVFMYRSLNSRETQPVGVFASRGAAPGLILAKLLISCILRLESAGVRVCAVICDGASPNKNLWKELGISGTLSKFANKIIHPSNTSDKDRINLHFLIDVPHVIKCVRNNVCKKKTVKFDNKDIHFGYYESVYKLDKVHKSIGLRVAPKITEYHINPNAFQKMNVALATQLFSKSMADAIEFYRKHGVVCMKRSEHTELFTRKINDIFDALNARYSLVGVKHGSQKYKNLEDFYKIIEDSQIVNTFASELSLDSLRVSIKSTLNIIDYLIQDCGFKYVLTAKLNQDCLEQFVGLVRQGGGSNDHPTMTTFLQLYRLLCLYAPTSRAIKGNVQPGDHEPISVTGYADILLGRAKSLKLDRQSRRKDVEDKILEVLVDSFPTGNDNVGMEEHNYAKSTSEDCLVYNLCGYIASRGEKFTSCIDCLESLHTSQPVISSVSLLTITKDLGGLKYPSNSFYYLIRNYIDSKINLVLGDSRTLVGDAISAIVGSLNNVNCRGIGCSVEGHRFHFVTSLISYYINVRAYFFIRIYKREKVKSQIKTKNKRKTVKLV